MDGGDRRRLHKALRRAGYAVALARSGHWAVRDRHGRRVATMPATLSDWRAWRNAIADLRRSGFTWPPNRNRRRTS